MASSDPTKDINGTSPQTFLPPRRLKSTARRTTVQLADGISKVVHRQLLVASSEKYARALNPPDKKRGLNKLELPEIDYDMFEIYMDWLYGRGITPKGKKLPELLVLQVYLFAHREEIPQLKRAVLTQLAEDCILSGTVPDVYAVKIAFEELPASDPLLQWMVEKWAACYQPDGSDLNERAGALAQASSTFLGRLVVCMTQLRPMPVSEAPKDVCDFHAHSNDEERSNCEMKPNLKRKRARTEFCEFGPDSWV